MMRPLLALLLLSVTASASPAQTSNPQIDYPGFEQLTGNVRDYRNTRLVGWAEFPGCETTRAVLLDARSADVTRRGTSAGR